MSILLLLYNIYIYKYINKYINNIVAKYLLITFFVVVVSSKLWKCLVVFFVVWQFPWAKSRHFNRNPHDLECHIIAKYFSHVFHSGYNLFM